MSNANDASTLYPTFFKKWQTAGMLKLLGPKPTAEQLAKVHALGPRPGKQAFIIAMSLRDCGVTPAQMVLITGTKHLNKMGDLTTDAYLREVLMPQVDGMKCYKREITPKGAQRIERFNKAQAATVAAGEAEAVKVDPRVTKAKAAKKRTSAPRKPKVTPATADKLPTVSPVENQPLNGGPDTPDSGVTEPGFTNEGGHITDLPENTL